jgi:hypothetical protein
MQNLKTLRYIDMIIVNTNTVQTFPIIPIRQFNEYENDIIVEVTNETTKQVYTRLITYRDNIKDVYYIGADNFDFLIENTFFTLKVYFADILEVIYKDRMFCTNQDIDAFTINENQYTLPNIDNNSYITI